MMINKFQLGGDIQQKLALDLVSNGVPQETVLELSKNKELWGQLVLIYLQEGIQGVANALQQLTKAARHGTKLQYIKSLKNQCAEDEELYYYKKGGSVKCGCKKKEEGGQVEKAQTGWKTIFKKRKENTSNNSTSNNNSSTKKDNTIYVSRKKAEEAEKYRKEEEKKKKTYVPDKSEEGAPPKGINKGMGKNKCGGKMKKESNGSKVIKEFKAKCGAKMKKHQLGGSLNGIPFMLAGTPKGGLPTAPKAQDRYKGAYVFKNGSKYIDNDIRYSNYPTTRIVSNVPYNMTPAIITESIVSPGDTLYTEIPEQKRFSLRWFPVERRASTKNPKGQEKNILQRRFREALNVANPNALHWFYK